MRRRGFTLLEIIVASLVMGLLVTAMYQLLVRGGSIFLRSQTRADLHSAGQLGLQRMTAELRESAFAYLTIATSASDPVPPALAFRAQDPQQLAVGPFVPTPYFVVYFYRASTRQLMRKVWGNVSTEPLTLTVNPLALDGRVSVTQLNQIASTLNTTEHAVVGMVDRLTVTPADYPVTAPVPGCTVRVALDLSNNVGATTFSETVSTLVTLRNKR